jgi:uncharacterized membrane protein YwzB
MEVPIVPVNSNIVSPPPPFSRYGNEPYAYSNTSNTPSALKKWYSNDIFRVVTFFVLVVAVLGISASAFFVDKLSADQMLGIISSLLFLATPSPLQSKPKKKIVYQTLNNPV